MIEEAVKNGGSDGGVPAEDGGLLFEGLVGGEHDGTALVACTDDSRFPNRGGSVGDGVRYCLFHLWTKGRRQEVHTLARI
jgi:hypothetical protein